MFFDLFQDGKFLGGCFGSQNENGTRHLGSGREKGMGMLRRRGWMGLGIVGLMGLMGGLGVEEAKAGDRRFTYVYEAGPFTPGEVEIENWVTFKTTKDSDPHFTRFEFRHEIEIGITEQLGVAFYLADWRYQDGAKVENDGIEYRNSAVEVIYNFTNPTVDPLGFSLYGEYKGGPELHELEGKVLLQKNIDQWVIAYNVFVEAEWEQEDGGWEDVGVVGQTVGVSYQVTPAFLVGGELVHEIELPGWSDAEDSVVYVGPNASYRGQQWFVTVTPLFQVTNVEGEPNFQTRVIFGFHF